MTTLEVKHWTPDYFTANQLVCKHILENLDTLTEIPSLNSISLDNFKDKQLVRFQGMIQDMYNPEYYFEQYEVKNVESGTSDVRCGMYVDAARCLPCEEIIFNSDKNKNSKRQTCVVISTPGLNDWAKENIPEMIGYNRNTITSQSISKRNFDESEDESMNDVEPVKKKEKTVSNDVAMETDSSLSKEEKSPVGLSKEHMLNFPIPIDDGKACIVKIYDNEIPLKLNQVLDIIGFISLDPLLSAVHDSEETMDDIELNTHNPPVSLIPRLHAVKVIKLTTPVISNTPEIVSKAKMIRDDLHIVFSQLLFGDHLAADYLICHLLSSIYMRKDYLCLGTFPVNITHFPIAKYRMFPKEFYEFLKLLVRKSHFLEITLENLNDLSLTPKKDYECNRLTSGILQLSDNTHLVIDETGLSSGQVSPNGRLNYKAITDLITFQKVAYDFKYYTMEYETDIPVLILSEVKSFFPCQTQVVLKPDQDSENLYPQVMEAAKVYLKDENRLNNIRHYLQAIRHIELQINDDISNVIQEDFVRLRQGNKSITADNLHSLIVFARLMSLSYGTNTVTTECWKRTMELEMERMNRLSSHAKKPQEI